MNVDILADLTGIDRINAIAAHLESLPQVQRDPVTRAYQRSLPAWEAAELKYFWSLHSRDSQLPPDGDWDSWLILAGRGFGKTRTGAEWVRAQVESGKASRVALVARSLPEAQFVMIEGESGIIAACPPWNKPWYEPSKRKLTWPNGAFALAFSSHEPDQLRGPQFHAAWCDEMAAWEYPEQTWDNLSFALRLGRYPRAVITTTPKTHRADPLPPQQVRRPRHSRLDFRKPAQPAHRLPKRPHRTVRRHTARTPGDPRRAHRPRRRRTLETRVDRESAAQDQPPHVPRRRRRRPRSLHQAHQLRDRNRRRRSRQAAQGSIRPGRRVRPSDPE